ncbi:MAG: hypothetical protein E6R03_09415 [Hyphomicrobiaceae bacterium]|nr:MAG: hypothetical protein E6R03_09415 [Hyphomicrobiaceae bacterium]
MSKSAKTKNKVKRDSAKRARREANRMKFAPTVGTVANRKKKSGSGGSQGLRKSRCSGGSCGNSGCARCTATLNDPWAAEPGSCLYSKRFTSRKHRHR